jgi:hypothetical protein
MLKKLIDGVVFGCGFAIAFAAIWTAWSIGMAYFMQRIMDSAITTAKEPEFKNPVNAQTVGPASGMKVPPGGGILAM